jgi:hypothetical protein
MDDTDLECCTCPTCRGKLVPRGTGFIHATREFIAKKLDEVRADMHETINRAMDDLRRETRAAINRASDDTIIDLEELRRTRRDKANGGTFSGYRET